MDYNLTNFERETIINFNDAEKTASIYTCSQSLIRKLDILCEKYPDQYKLDTMDSVSKTYTCFNKKLIAIRAPVKRKELTDEERKILSERMKKNIHNKKK